jgi:hypothetical protein
VAAEVDHFSLFIVLARPGQGALPANIVIQKVTVDPPGILVGQSSDVRIRVINIGGMPGEYVVVVRVDGKIQKTQSVKLGAGEIKEVALIISPGLSGVYTVTAGSASEQVIVRPWISSDVAEVSYWWLLCISLGFSTLIFTLFRRKSTH